jgi:hypothetical protein
MVFFQYEAQCEYDWLYASIPVPNLDSVALEAKFGAIEEFMETEAKKPFS